MRLQAVERKLDWNVSRRKVELHEAVTGNRVGGVRFSRPSCLSPLLGGGAGWRNAGRALTDTSA